MFRPFSVECPDLPVRVKLPIMVGPDGPPQVHFPYSCLAGDRPGEVGRWLLSDAMNGKAAWLFNLADNPINQRAASRASLIVATGLND